MFQVSGVLRLQPPAAVGRDNNRITDAGEFASVNQSSHGAIGDFWEDARSIASQVPGSVLVPVALRSIVGRG